MDHPFIGISVHALIIANLVASAYMTGVIWFVQLVHYPLFAAVGREGFAAYEQRHAYWTGWVVAPPMIFELLAASLLAIDAVKGNDPAPKLAAFVLVLIAWISTFALQVPCHNRLHHGFDHAVHQRLVRTNWLRIFAWTLRTALLVVLLLRF